MLGLRSCFILILLCLAPGAQALTLTGVARAVDGDTLSIGTETVRLFGIDAPEVDQTCTRDGQAWACGKWAGKQLSRRLHGATVTCTGRTRDRYDRLLAVCQIAGADLNAVLVSEGAAFAYRRYSHDYVGHETVAREHRLGIWAGEVRSPESFRHGDAEGQVSGGEGATALAGACEIKGNISARGERIYHVPGQENYAQTRISAAQGERWFCTPTEAEAAGWRAARR